MTTDHSSKPLRRDRHRRAGLRAADAVIFGLGLLTVPPSGSASAMEGTDPLTNIYVVGGSGESQPCYRSTSGSQSRYYCRNLLSDGWDGVWELPYVSTHSQVSPGNFTVTYEGETLDGYTSASGMYEGCRIHLFGFWCDSAAENISINDYSSSGWVYYGNALSTWFKNTGTAATCLYAIYHAAPDITSCL